MSPDDGADEGQPEPDAGWILRHVFLKAGKGCKERTLLGRTDAATVILYGHRPGAWLVKDLADHFCTGGAVLYGIVQKVAEDSSKQGQITHDPGRICGFIKANINILLLRLDPELITTLGNQLNQVQTPGRQGRGLGARKVYESVDQDRKSTRLNSSH